MEKTVIRANTENYQRAKAASGAMSQHNGDSVAVALAGLPLESVALIAAKMTSDDNIAERYAHLNIGQQRMNLGNRIRGAVSKVNKAKEKAIVELAKFEALAPEAKEGKTAPVVPELTGEQVFAAVAAPFVEAAAKEAEAKLAEELAAKEAKEAAAKAKAEAKEAAAKAKAEAKEAAAKESDQAAEEA